MKHCTTARRFARSIRNSMLAPAWAWLALLAAPGAVALDYQAAADYSAAHNGLAVAVMLDGNVVFEQYAHGHTSADSNHLHSGTKAFWGVAVAALVEDGWLSFEEFASQTLTEWQSDAWKSEITVSQLLDLTSGLGEDSDALGGLDGTASDKYAFATSLPAEFAPGARFRYGPSQYYALGELIRRKLLVTGQDPLDYLQARILDPLGITVDDWAYDDANNPHIPNGAYLTAIDWIKFGQLVLQRGRWQGSQLIQAGLMDRVLTPGAVNPGHGLTVWLNAPGGWDPNGQQAPPDSPAGFIFPPGYPDLIGAMGAGKNRMYMIPSLGLVAVRLAEAANDAFSDAEFLALLLEEDYDPPPGGERVIRISAPNDSYVDPEFLQSESKVTFVSHNKAWLADMDPYDGGFLSGNGRDLLVDDGIAPVETTYNGPEIGLDAQGWAVFYSKADGELIQIWRATPDGSGLITEPLTFGEQHQTPLVSVDPGSPTTRVLAMRGDWFDGTAVWFDEADPGATTDLGMVRAGTISTSWVRGTQLALWIEPDGPDADLLVLHDTVRGLSRVITREPGRKVDPYGWRAPEYDDAVLVLAVIDDHELAVYKDNGGADWDRIATLGLPITTSNTFMGSPEPFVAEGKSYVTLTIKSEDQPIGEFDDGEIWILGIEPDPADRYEQRCDDGAETAARFDPETYLGVEEVFVYYNLAVDANLIELYRCRSGIAASDLATPGTPEVADDGEYTRHADRLRASWDLFDPDERVEEFDYRILQITENSTLTIRDWTAAGQSSPLVATGLDLNSGGEYVIGVRGRFGDGYHTPEGRSDGIVVDSIAPVFLALLDDGVFTTSNDTLHASFETSDFGSGVQSHSYSVGTTPEAADVRPWTSLADDSSVTATGLVLTDGVEYYISVEAVDHAGNATRASTGGIIVDSTPPQFESISDDGDYTRSSHVLAASWTGQDAVSGLASYRYSIGTVPGASNVKDWVGVGKLTSVHPTGLDLQDGATYYFNVEAADVAGNTGIVSTDGITVDLNAPRILFVNDYGDYTPNADSLRASWNAIDATSFVAEYEYAVGTVAGPETVVPWTSAGTDTSVVISGLSLEPRTSYIIHVRASDAVGNVSRARADGIRLDNEPPTIIAIHDQGEFVPPGQPLRASWVVTDSASGIAGYRYAIGSSAGATDVRGWTDVGTETSVSVHDLVLIDGMTYFFGVEASDRLGNTSVGYSDGVTYDASRGGGD